MSGNAGHLGENHSALDCAPAFEGNGSRPVGSDATDVNACENIWCSFGGNGSIDMDSFDAI